jgi:hypothetical protein
MCMTIVKFILSLSPVPFDLSLQIMLLRRVCNVVQSRSRCFSNVSLSPTMKKLIDARRYKDALDLFDRQSNVSTDSAFNLALKACTKLADTQRGIRIHQKLSPQLLQDPFIQTALIHFYSKSQSSLII